MLLLSLGALWSMLSPLVANAAGMVSRTTVVATRACLIASLVWNIHFGVEIVGIDETSLCRGQDYIAVVQFAAESNGGAITVTTLELAK